jgi:hypothetical protein
MCAVSAATLSVVCTTSVARLRSPAGTENFVFATVSGAYPMGTRWSVGGQSDTLTPSQLHLVPSLRISDVGGYLSLHYAYF